MTRKFLSTTGAVVFLIAVACPSPAAAEDPTLIFAKALLNKLVLDPAWDFVLGKPDLLGPIQKRLRELEKNAALRSELRDEVRKLREGLNNRVTRAEFRKMVERTTAEIATIQSRLDDLEERVEKLEVENADLKNGTKNASSAEYFRERGDRFAADNRVPRALANYTIAIKLDRSLAAAYRGRCGVYERLGAWGVVLAAATEGLGQTRGSTAWFHRQRAIARAKLWELRPASLNLPLDPVLRPARHGADVKELLDPEVKEFLSDCARALSANASDVPILCFRGLARVGVGSRIYYPKGVRLDVSITTEQANKAIAGLNESRRPWFEGAKADFDAAIRADATCHLAYCGRGVAYSGLGKQDAALADLTEAIRLDPRQKDAYVCRAGVNRTRASGQLNAIEDLRKALEIDPGDTAIIKLLKQWTGK